MKLVVLSHPQKLKDLASTDGFCALQNEVCGAVVGSFLMVCDTACAFVAEKGNEGLAVVPDRKSVV